MHRHSSSAACYATGLESHSGLNSESTNLTNAHTDTHLSGEEDMEAKCLEVKEGGSYKKGLYSQPR